MVATIKQKIRQIRKCSSIEVIYDSADHFIMNSITLSLQKNTVKKNAVTHLSSSIEALRIDKGVPLTLVLNGKGILVKKVGKVFHHSNPIAAILPQANPNEFYVQLNEHRDYTIIAVARRTIVDSLIATFQQKGFTILNIHLGPAIVETIVPFIDTTTHNTITVGAYGFTLSDQGLTDITTSLSTTEPDTAEYVVANQYIQARHLLPYAAAVTLLSSDLTDDPSLVAAPLKAARETFIYKNYYKAAALGLVATIFVLLLVNFLLYDHYYTRNKEMAVTKGISQQQLQQAQHISKNIGQKERFLSNAGWIQPVKTSFFADRFARLLPEGVWLTNLQFYPLQSDFLSDAEGLHFKKDTVLLTGTCTDARQINTLINNLKTMKEIKDIGMKAYNYMKEEDKGEFSLEIITQ